MSHLCVQFVSLAYHFSFLYHRVVAGSFRTDVWLERVYVRKVNWKPTKVKAVVGQNKQELQFKMLDDNVLVIRKPGFKFSDDWLITIG